MSWDVELVNEKGEIVTVPCHEEGGTFVLGGTNRAELNITWNYAPFYYEYLDSEQGLKWIDNKKAKDVIQRLEQAIQKLGMDRNPDYWAATAGNAGYALSILYDWATAYPDATFEVS